MIHHLSVSIIILMEVFLPSNTIAQGRQISVFQFPCKMWTGTSGDNAIEYFGLNNRLDNTNRA